MSQKRKAPAEFYLPKSKQTRLIPAKTSPKKYISPFAKYAYIEKVKKSRQPVLSYTKKLTQKSNNKLVSYYHKHIHFINTVVKPFIDRITNRLSYEFLIHIGYGNYRRLIHPLSFRECFQTSIDTHKYTELANQRDSPIDVPETTKIPFTIRLIRYILDNDIRLTPKIKSFIRIYLNLEKIINKREYDYVGCNHFQTYLQSDIISDQVKRLEKLL
jgi:hypothetical protein